MDANTLKRRLDRIRWSIHQLADDYEKEHATKNPDKQAAIGEVVALLEAAAERVNPDRMHDKWSFATEAVTAAQQVDNWRDLEKGKPGLDVQALS